MGGYKRYIEGVYYQGSKLHNLTPGMRETLDALRNGYPDGWTPPKLAEKFELNENSTYQNCDKLHEKNIVEVEKEKGVMTKRDRITFYFEDYNYISNKKKDFVYPFAPGYVQYDEDFLDNFEKLNVKFKDQIYKIYSLLMDILEDAVRHEKHTHSPQHCKFCGYDHEMRDFMRATLLHLIDGIEEHDQFINFLLNEKIVNEAIYERPETELRLTPVKMDEQKETVLKELPKEQQSFHLMEIEGQTARRVTPQKQYKRKPHTAEWKLQNSLRMKRRWKSKNEDEKQAFIESVRKYPIEQNSFDNLRGDAKYWIGYIMARGSVKRSSPGSPSVKISALKEDRNHLDKFKEFIKSGLSIYDHKKRGVYEFEFRSGKIVSELEKYGIHDHMGYHQKVKRLEDDKDFWRGFIDGNGRFEVSIRDNIYLRVNKGGELIRQFKTFAEKILKHSLGEPKLEVKNWSLTIAGTNAVELYEKLWYDKNSIALDRSLKWLKQAKSSPKYKAKA